MGTPSLWQEQHPGRRYPALEGAHHGDVCVVGAGITGASCAWRLLEHGLAVAVLEAREPAAGRQRPKRRLRRHRHRARARPAGPAAGRGQGRRLHRATERALAAMTELAAELRVPDAIRRTGSLWLADQDEAAEMAQAVSAARAAGVAVEDADATACPAAMRDWVAAGRLPARRRRAAAGPLGARADGGRRRARCGTCSTDRRCARSTATARAGGSTTGAGELRADAVVVACDGLTGRLLPELAGAVYPVRGQVAATEPLAEVPLACPTHSQYGFMYYRPTADGRVLVGGGRLEHLEDEYTDDERTTAAVQAQLDRFLRDRLGLGGARVTHRWAGIMGFSADLLPLAGPVTGDGRPVRGRRLQRRRQRARPPLRQRWSPT